MFPSSAVSSSAILFLFLLETSLAKYIDVCPTPGVTDGCQKIGIDPVDIPEKTTVVVPSVYQSGKDYSDVWIAPPMTGTPTKPIEGETSTYTSVSQTTSDRILVVVPIIVPIEPGAPIPPPEIPGEPEPPPPETLEPEKATESETKTDDGPTTKTNDETTTEDARYCTRPTPVQMKEPVKPTSHTTTYKTTPDEGNEPKPTTSCDHAGDNDAGYDPGLLNDLTPKFCVDAMGSSTKTVEGIKGTSIEFSYEEKDGNCPKSCQDTIADMVLSCQYDSHTITGSAKLEQACGIYSFAIKKGESPTTTRKVGDAPPATKMPPKGLASTTACWSGDPGKQMHTSRVSAYVSSECSQLSASINGGYPQASPYLYAFGGYDMPDGGGSTDADMSTVISMYIEGEDNNLGEGETCFDGFKGALDCPNDDGLTWGGTKWVGKNQYSVWANDNPQKKGKRDALPGPRPAKLPDLHIDAREPSPSLQKRDEKPREVHLYAYSACPEVDRCATGFAIADHYAFSGSMCDAEGSEISLYGLTPERYVAGETAFKSFGHERCHIRPGVGKGWGSIECGDIMGECQASSEKKTMQCTDTVKGSVPGGTVLKQMAICKF